MRWWNNCEVLGHVFARWRHAPEFGSHLTTLVSPGHTASGPCLYCGIECDGMVEVARIPWRSICAEVDTRKRTITYAAVYSGFPVRLSIAHVVWAGA